MSSSLRRGLAPPTLLLLLLSLLSSASAAAQVKESWLGVYLMGNKLGHAHLVVTPTQHQGKPALKVVNKSRLRMSILGQTTEQSIDSVDVSTPQYRPLTSDFTMTSMGQTTRVTATFEPTRVVARMTSSGSSSTKVVPIPKGARLSMDPALGLGAVPKLGASMAFHYFNPITLAIERATVRALKRETISHQGVAYPTTQVWVKTPMGDMTAWQDDSGDLVKMEAVFGVEMWRETREQALGNASDKFAPPPELSSAVRPDREIESPRSTRYLKLRLTGLRSKDLIQDDRQKAQVTRSGDTYTADLVIQARDVPLTGTVTVQQASKASPAWLKPSDYIQSADPKLKALARQIVGTEKNALKAVLKLRDWVHGNMKVRSDIALLRSALDVLKDRQGVCRDYAVLYAGLARAAGIPTRIATGLVYADGAFYYHAWAESYVGKWVDVDPTAPSPLVDATHIKFTRGDADSMLASGRFAGELKAEIQEVR